MTKKVLFIDRDGTLIKEPADQQVDALSKIELVAGVIPALRSLKSAGYEFVIVSNQDGLGTPAFPETQFEEVRQFMLRLFASQGIEFAAEFYCPHVPDDQCACRKPRTGLLSAYLTETSLDSGSSAVIGDRDTDLELARNLGLRGFKYSENSFDESWEGIRHALVDRPRTANVERNTNETSIRVAVDLDREADAEVTTGIGFFDHMLEQLGKHGGFALKLECKGDLQVDEHHTIEDSALARP